MRRLGLAVALALVVATFVRADESRVWMEISVFCQCCEPPWGKSETDIRPFFYRNGIPVYGYRKEGRIVCAACSCPSNLRQLIRVRAADMPRVRALLARAPDTRTPGSSGRTTLPAR